VTGPDGTWTYQYDALGNLVGTVQNGTSTQYVIDPVAASIFPGIALASIAQAYGQAGNPIATYHYGLGLAAVTGGAGNALYFNTDLIGNVTSVSGPSDNLIDSYFYLPFGETIQTGGNSGNPFQYGGGLGITSDGSGLDFMRARFYDPVLGRFVSRDPINLAGGANLYDYAGNAPTFQTDPSGQYWSHWHYGITYVAASNAGWNSTDASNLAWNTVWVDDKFTQGAGGVLPNIHAMKSISQTPDEALNAINFLLTNDNVPLWVKLHTVQDAMVDEHFLQTYYGLWFIGLDHVYHDIVGENRD
jgi:RHS repeat-associated protein